ncbi:MAG: hypothetical protein KGQ46_03645 [Hyphomicrobiales bacterium]|nr:hypothetical protein [Hyphomicrobiales bacterium]MDE2115208.1 hypothetical protein [Hyphomicrobiales bacterium]
MTMQTQANPATATFIRANLDQAQLPPSAFQVPADVASAMQVQAEVAQGLDAAIGGWKLGFNKQGQVIAGPMFASHMHQGPVQLALPRQRVLVEVEIAFKLARDLPPREKPYLRAEVLSHVGQVIVGIELLHPRVDAQGAEIFPLWLADRLGNWGYVAGEGRADFAQLVLAELACELAVDGVVVHQKIGGHPQNDPVAPLLAYANAQNDRLGGMKAGQIITTGSLTPPFYFDAPTKLRGSVAGLGKVELAFSKA